MRRLILRLFVASCMAQSLLGGLSSLADDVASSTAPGTTKHILHIDDLHAVYGQYGSKRHATFIAGEQLHFAAKISGISVASNGHCDFDYTYSLVDPSGNVIKGSSGGTHIKNLLALGGGVSTVSFSINTETSAAADRYILKFAIHDNLVKQVATKELEITVFDKTRSGIINASLYRDRDCLHPSSGNITLGEPICVKCDIRVPKNKNNEAVCEASITFFDRNNNKVDEFKPKRQIASNISSTGIQFFVRSFVTIFETGYYRIHIEAKDVSTNRIDKYDLPLVIIAPPGTPALAVDPIASKSQGVVEKVGALHMKNNLSIDVYPTLGKLGSPRDATFLFGENATFIMMLRDVSANTDREGDCTFEFSILDSHSLVCVSDTKAEREIKQVILTGNKSFTVASEWPSGSVVRPGRYTARFIIKDNVAKTTASKDIAITVVDNDTFALADLGLYNDQGAVMPTGPNLTIGDTVYVRSGVYIPKKSAGNDLEVRMSFLDVNRKEIASNGATQVKKCPSAAAYRYVLAIPFWSETFVPNRPGSYFIRLELKDLVTQETVTKEIPFNVFLPPELPEIKNASKLVPSAAASPR